jgi:MATE family multidrug resistance protein
MRVREREGSTWLSETFRVCNIVVPSALGNLCEYLPVCTGIALVGQLTHDSAAAELDALGLARAYFNMAFMAPGFGYISALRTLCPQAVGAGQPRVCALHVQRAVLLVLCGFLAAAPLLLFSERIMMAAGQRPDLAALAAPYVLRLAPSYLGVLGMSAFQRIFQAHGFNYANLMITAVVCATAPPLQWLFVHRLGWGYLGAAWAQSLYNFLYLLLQLPYLAWCGHGYVFRPQAPRLLFNPAGVCEHLKLAAPGFWMIVLEWWMCEAVVLISGLFSSPTACIGAMAITANLQALGAMAWIGLAVASSTLVGRHIGAGRVAEARRAAGLALGVGAVIAGLVALTLTTLPGPIALAFTKDVPISNLTTALLPLLGAIIFVDATSNALGGVCSGLGLQRVSAAGQLVGNYVIGLPAGVGLAFLAVHGAKEGVYFLWGGVGLSMLTAALVQLVALLRLDWSAAARKAAERLACDLPVHPTMDPEASPALGIARQPALRDSIGPQLAQRLLVRQACDSSDGAVVAGAAGDSHRSPCPPLD